MYEIKTDVIRCKICDRQRFNFVLLLHLANKKVMQQLPLCVYLCVCSIAMKVVNRRPNFRVDSLWVKENQGELPTCAECWSNLEFFSVHRTFFVSIRYTRF